MVMGNPLKNAIVGILGEEKSKALSEFFKKVNFNTDGNTVPPPAAPPEPKVMSTKSGKKLAVTGDLKEGAEIMDVTGESPMPFEGTEELTDGTKVTALAGNITAIEQAVVQQIENPALMGFKNEFATFAAEFKAQKVEFEKLKKENEELRATILDHGKVLNENAKFMVELLETPATTENKPKKTLSIDELKELQEKDGYAFYKYMKEHNG